MKIAHIKSICNSHIYLYPDKTYAWENGYSKTFRRGEHSAIIHDNLDDWLKYGRSLLRGNISAGTSIYFERGCLISRDLVRNSGIKITRNADTADYIVLPRLDKQMTTYTPRIIRIENDVLYCIYVQHDRYYHPDDSFTEKETEFVHDVVSQLPGEIFFQPELTPITVTLMPVYETFEKVLDAWYNQNCHRKFIFETDIPFQTQIAITPEQLVLWYNMDAKEVALAQIAVSDYRDYPITLGWLVKDRFRSQLRYSNNVGYALDQLGISVTKHELTQLVNDNYIVQPKDWNMLQSFLCLKLQISEEGQEAPSISWFADSAIKWVKHKVFTKPYFITAPVAFGELKKSLGL